jgi:hypothetical protein
VKKRPIASLSVAFFIVIPLLASFWDEPSVWSKIVAVLALGTTLTRFHLGSVAYLRSAFSIQAGNSAPPVNAQFLFYLFLDAKNCDALVGDLEERYKLIFKKFGASRANFWYWTQAIRSVGPIVWKWTKAVMKRLSGLAALLEIWRRIRG